MSALWAHLCEKCRWRALYALRCCRGRLGKRAVYTALTASPRRLWDSHTAGKNLNHLHVIQVDRLHPHDCDVCVIDTKHVISLPQFVNIFRLTSDLQEHCSWY